jgi:hypothetical protein
MSREELNQEIVKQYAQDILEGRWHDPNMPDPLSPERLRGTVIRVWQASHNGEIPNDEQMAQLTAELLGEYTPGRKAERMES